MKMIDAQVISNALVSIFTNFDKKIKSFNWFKYNIR